jgi:hypothetical protein
MTGDELFKNIMGVTSIAGLSWGFVVWINNFFKDRREKRTALKQGAVVTQEITELKVDIKELKRADIDQQEDIMNIEKKIEQVERDHHDFMMLMMGRKT